MVKEKDMGQGFVMNKEKGIMKDGKVVFTPDQLTALILCYDLFKGIRAQMSSAGFGEIFKDFFKEDTK